MNKSSDCVQLSFFDSGACEPKFAVSLFDGSQYSVQEPEGWMRNLVQGAQYLIYLGGHPVVLSPINPKNKIAPGLEYIHYKVGDDIYSSIGVGKDLHNEMDDSV